MYKKAGSGILGQEGFNLLVCSRNWASMELEIPSRFNSMLILLFLLFFTAAINCASDYTIIAQDVCKASRDPPACVASISSVPPTNATLLGAILYALRVSSHNRDVGRGMVQEILDSSATNFNRSNAAIRCLEGLRYSEYRTNSASRALLGGAIKDARSWMSAALGYQYGCWSGLKYVNDTAEVGKAMSFFNSELIVSSVNALAMIVNYDIFGDKTGLWCPPKTERDGFWEPASEPSDSYFVGGVPTVLNPDATVCKSGDCNYLTVQEAVNSVPDNLPAKNRFTIWIKAGVYEEMVRVPYEKKNVIFLGDGVGKTVITGSMSVGQPRVTTYDTATVGVVGDGFMATGLTIQNTAGPELHQAVAFRSSSDLSVIENCEFIGNQDTLYAHSLRQYYKSCTIQGNVDFIFGNAAALFQDCIILIAPRQVTPEKGETNAMTAQGRIDPAQSTGFVFHNCLINGTASYMSLYLERPRVHNNYLGRPWKEYSRTVFIRCTLEVLIRPEGWLPWSGDFALGTLYYGEFENVGRSSDSSHRVSWSSQIPAEHVFSYSVQNFIQGDQWIPTVH